MPDEAKIATSILRLLEAKRDNKKQEMDALTQPILDRTPEYGHRKFQVEVEYWQLKNTVDEIVNLASAAGLQLQPHAPAPAVAPAPSDAVKSAKRSTRRNPPAAH